MKSACIALAVLGLSACGPSAKPKKTPQPDPRVATDAGVSADDAGQALLTEAECETLFDHIFDVAFKNRLRDENPEVQLTEEDLRKAKDALRPELLADCVGATRRAFPYECAMAASTEDEMQRCVGAE